MKYMSVVCLNKAKITTVNKATETEKDVELTEKHNASTFATICAINNTVQVSIGQTFN